MKNVYESQAFAPVPVTGGLCWSEPGQEMRERVELTMGPGEGEREVKLLLGEDEQVEVRQNLPVRLKAPVRQGQKVGSVEYLLKGQVVESFPVYTAQGVEEITPERCLIHVLRLFTSLFDGGEGAKKQVMS